MKAIAYLGPENTNTHLAAKTKFGARARYLHAPTIDDVFDFVEREKADVGVVPIENSLEGAVTHTLDRFIDFKRSPSHIIGEFEFRIHHHFITDARLKAAEVQLVYSHPQALAQCRRWLEETLSKRVTLMETNSTAEAVRSVHGHSLAAGSTGRPQPVAAIGHREAAKEYGLEATPIPDERDNKTRFFIIGLTAPPKARRNKTSILFAIKDRPGALYDTLLPFKREGINLTKIESRPSKQKAWEYYFFIDFEGHAAELRVKRALKALEGSTSVLRVLGSYPIAK